MASNGDVLRNVVTGHEYRILQSSASTDGALLDMAVRFPPGAPRPPAHVHPRQEEHFELRTGALTVDIGGVTRTLAPGDTLVVPAGTPHAMWNAGDAVAEVRWQTRPALRTEQFFETVVALAAAGQVGATGTPRLPALALLLHRFSAEMQLAAPPRAVQRLVIGAVARAAYLAGARLPAPSST